MVDLLLFDSRRDSSVLMSMAPNLRAGRSHVESPRPPRALFWVLCCLQYSMVQSDMVRAVKCELLRYADYSALVFSGKNLLQIESQFSHELESLSV